MYLKFHLNFQIHPAHLRSIYEPYGRILAILYREVPHMFHAKYQPNRPSGFGGEVV